MTPEERQEIRERHKQFGNLGVCTVSGHSFPCDTARLLADYDHLVEVARAILPEVQDVEIGSVIDCEPTEALRRLTAKADRWVALRALIDPATPEPDLDVDGGTVVRRPLVWSQPLPDSQLDAIRGRDAKAANPATTWAVEDRRHLLGEVDRLRAPATPEPVEGEPNA